MTNQLPQARARLRPYGSKAQQAAATAADTSGVQVPIPLASSLRAAPRPLDAQSDERLVSALQGGDERGFETIYDRHHGALLAFCRHMLGSREEAEDALQQVFVSAHRHLAEGRERVHLRPWLYAIARNRCVSILRARRETYALEPAHEPSTDGLAVADEVERREEIQEMLGDLNRLPDDQRAALLLAELGDLSQQEIAAALEIRTQKVKALIFQAREALSGWRQARATDCREIQAQLATLRGSALRRGQIRRHVELCATCAAFEREVARQRAAIGLLLPVIPTAALKHSVLSSVLSTGSGVASAGAAGAAVTAGAVSSGAAVSGGGAALAGAGASGLAVKALAVAALAVGGGGGAVAVHELRDPRPLTAAPAAAPARTPAAAPTAGGPKVPAAAHPASAAARGGAATPSRSERTRGRSADAPGRSRGRSADAPGRSRGRSADAPGRSRAPGAMGRGSQRAAKNRGHGRPAAAKRPPHATKPAAKSPAAKSPTTPAAKSPAAKGGPTTPAAAKPPHKKAAPVPKQAAPPAAVPHGKAKVPPAKGG